MISYSSTESLSQNPVAQIQAELEVARAQEEGLAQERLSENARRLYESYWQGFLTWVCRDQQSNPDLSALPASDETLALYVSHEINTSTPTFARRLSKICLMHRWSGLESPVELAPSFNVVYNGYKRRWAARQLAISPLTAATESIVRTLADAWTEDSLIAKLNRALLLVCFDSALRRSELVEKNLEHLASHPEGLEIHISQSKSYQTGQGAAAYLLARPDSTYYPVTALAAGVHEGPVFRRLYRCGLELRLCTERLSDKAVYRVVMDTAKNCSVKGRFGAHSLRRGLITSAQQNNPEHLGVTGTCQTSEPCDHISLQRARQRVCRTSRKGLARTLIDGSHSLISGANKPHPNTIN